MNHFARIQQALPGAELDAVLLTCRANRFYATGFDASDTDGACLITPGGISRRRGPTVRGRTSDSATSSTPTGTCLPKRSRPMASSVWALTTPI